MGCLAVFLALDCLGFRPSVVGGNSGNRMACVRCRRGGRICGYLPLCSVETGVLLRDFQTCRGGDLVAGFS